MIRSFLSYKAMEVYHAVLGPVETNCYIVVKDGHCLIVDPGDKIDLREFFEQKSITPDAILLTHAHFDHIDGVDGILDSFDIPVYLNPLEFDFLTDSTLNASADFMRDQICNATPTALQEGHMEIGPFDVEVTYCPGHTLGSTVFQIENSLFSGDVLFQGSCGRTDLPTGNPDQMNASLAKLKKLDDNIIVYPGHGPATTIGQEKKTNYYMIHA